MKEQMHVGCLVWTFFFVVAHLGGPDPRHYTFSVQFTENISNGLFKILSFIDSSPCFQQSPWKAVEFFQPSATQQDLRILCSVLFSSSFAASLPFAIHTCLPVIVSLQVFFNTEPTAMFLTIVMMSESYILLALAFIAFLFFRLCPTTLIAFSKCFLAFSSKDEDQVTKHWACKALQKGACTQPATCAAGSSRALISLESWNQ